MPRGRGKKVLPVQVTVNGLRIRVRLDEGRITELLKGLDGHATTTAGLLNCIGDLATISFAPHMAGQDFPSSLRILYPCAFTSLIPNPRAPRPKA